MTPDPFGTGALRRAVTEAWLASPTRFREDANSEEDHARGYYRDRVVVELAQNAADAAARAGVAGRLVLRLTAVAGDGGPGWRLVAANTGAPLDAEGVASLASLRASAKSGPGAGGAGAVVPDAGIDGGAGAGAGLVGGPGVAVGGSGSVAGAAVGVVGRFGVGFAAVRSVSDEILVRSRGGGVRFSLAATRAELGLTPPGDTDADLAAVVQGRGDALPVLRLPFAAPGVAGDEPDTVVELVLRDDGAAAAVSAQLGALDDALLLALPGLDEVVIQDDFAGQQGSEPPDEVSPPRVLRDVGARWRVHRTSGALTPDSTLPTEERRADWSVLWALPVGGSGRTSAVLHAPTPTDVRLTFPALLVASFPVDPGRRGVLPGPTTDRLAAEAGRAYAAFLGELAVGRDVLGLVPTGLPAGELDAAVRASADAALRATPLLPLPDAGREPAADGRGEPEGESGAARMTVAPQDAAYLAGALGEDAVLARVLAAGSSAVLVTVPVPHQAVVRSLGARAADLAELVEALPPEPGVVRAALGALAAHAGEPAVLEAVAGVPLPLADGRVSRGARGAVLLDGPHLGGIARALGVRVVHPGAAHPLLERAGATITSPRGLLADPAVRSAALLAAEEILEDGDADRLGRVLAAPVPSDEPLPGAAETVRAVLELVRLAVAGTAVPGLGDRAAGGTDHAGDIDIDIDIDIDSGGGGDGGESGGSGGGIGGDRAADTGLRGSFGVGDTVPGPDGGVGSGAADLPFWLGELPVVADGDVVPLREAALPGTWAARYLDLAVVSRDVVERWGQATLAAAGARAELGTYRVADVVTSADDVGTDHGPDDPAGWLSAWDEYVEHLADELGPGAWVGDVEAVPDLDVLRAGPAEGHPGDESLAAALRRVAAEPAPRRALLTPVRSPDAPGREAVSYTAWFLRWLLGAPFAVGDTPLLPPAPAATAGLDDAVLVALGGLHDLADLPGRDWGAVLERLPEPQGTERVRLPVAVARAVWAGLAELARSAGREPRAVGDEPVGADDESASAGHGPAAAGHGPVTAARLPALGPDGVTVERADDLAVAASPRWAQLGPVVPAPADVAADLADLLDLPYEDDPGVLPDAPGDVVELDPRVRALVPDAPATWRRHDRLTVEGTRVAWWVAEPDEGPAVAHADSAEGLARALAELTGADVLLLETALRDPDRAERLAAERAWP